MLAEVEDTVRSFGRAEVDALVAGLVAAVTWEPAFLAKPTGSVWAPVFLPDRREPLLASSGAGGAVLACGADRRARER